MASHAARHRKARMELAAKIASPRALTSEICDQIVKEGGPTYRTTRQGHVCVQTGARVKRGHCQSYTAQVMNGTTAMIAFRAGSSKKGKGRQIGFRAPLPPQRLELRALKWDGQAGHNKCPNCNRDFYVESTGINTCGYCDRQFVVEKVPESLTVKYYGSTNYKCPHCGRLTWLSHGLNTCQCCGKKINAAYD